MVFYFFVDLNGPLVQGHDERGVLKKINPGTRLL